MTMKPEKLALLARHKRMRDRQPELTKALRCYPDDHFRPLLSELLEEQDRLTAKMRLLEERIQERMEPHQELVERLCEIPGIERLAAWMVISEIGVDMSRFPTAGHLASCCGLCPGNAESAGKRHSAPAKANAMCGGRWCRQPGRRLASTGSGRFSLRCFIGSAAAPERRKRPSPWRTGFSASFTR